MVLEVGLYKILFYSKACVYASMIVCATTPFGWAPQFPLVARTIAQYSLAFTRYWNSNTNIVY